MIRVLFYIPELAEGGAEKALCSLVNHMDRDRFDITVCTLNPYDPKQYLTEGIHYRALNRCRTRIGRRLVGLLFRLCAELKLAYPLFIHGDFDVEVAYLETGATKLIAQSTNRRAYRLAWVHCDLSCKEGMREAVVKTRAQYRQFDRIVCVSEDVREGFCRLYGDSFAPVVVHNVIDDGQIRQMAAQGTAPEMSGEGTHLLAVGRLTRQKDFDRLIRTCARLRDAGCMFSLDILGEGPEREHLEKLIAEKRLTAMVRLRGYVRNPYPWMRTADLIVCSSRYEGISTVVQEAMILGKAIVTTPCTGMRELLGDSEYGLIADPGEDGLYDGLRLLLSQPKRIGDYARKAQERSAVFSMDRVLRETEEILTGGVDEHA